MNTETKAVADFLSGKETYTDIFTMVQNAQSDEQVAQQIEDYVIKQRRGPQELYQYLEQNDSDVQNIDWVAVAQTFKSD